jgi:ADP-heptose:LPS heptosyltransferase
VVARRVLLVVDDCGAGDALRLTPYVEAVRAAMSDARLDMIAGTDAAQVFRHSQSIDRLFVSRLYRRDRSPGKRRLAKAMELGRLALVSGARHDLVIVFWWGSRLLAMLARLTGSSRRVGYGDPGWFTTSLGRYDFDGDEVEQSWRLLAAAGISVRPAPAPSLEVPSDARVAADRLLAGAGWDGRSDLVLMHPGSDWACQQWLPERWSEVAGAIAAESGCHVVFTGAASERAQIEAIRARLRLPSGNLAGMTSFIELAAVVRRARLLVTVDSAAYVVACSQGAPVVVLAGPSHPERLAASSPRAIVQKMGADRARAIAAHRRQRFAEGGCSGAGCPFPGLQEITTADVLRAVSSMATPSPAAAVR